MTLPSDDDLRVMLAKTTPGPWSKSGDACIRSNGKDIAYLARNTMPNDQLHANLDVIALAPDLARAYLDQRARIADLEARLRTARSNALEEAAAIGPSFWDAVQPETLIARLVAPQPLMNGEK